MSAMNVQEHSAQQYNRVISAFGCVAPTSKLLLGLSLSRAALKAVVGILINGMCRMQNRVAV